MTTTGVTKNPSAPQVKPEIIAALRNIAVSLLSDNLHRNCGSIGLTPYHTPAPLAGTAVTVRTRGGDNLAVLRAYDVCRPGDVMVIDAGGDLINAVFGGIMSFAGQSMGLAGMVVDGAIRDVAEIRERTFPVYARGVSHRGPYKDGPGEINVPIAVEGMVIQPGDLVLGDDDGVVCVPFDDCERVLAATKAKHEAETRQMESILAGSNDRAWVDAALKRLNCEMQN